MKAFKVLVGSLMVLSLIGSVVLMLMANPLWPWGSALTAFFFATAAVSKAFYLGPGTLRGKFHFILATGALFLFAAMVVMLVSGTTGVAYTLHYLARFVFIVSVAMMFLGLLKQGYSLSLWEWVQVVLAFGIITGVALWFFYGLYAGASLMTSVLVYMSIVLMFITLAVVRVYLGSSLGWRWTGGAISVLFITLGDMALAYYSTTASPVWEITQFISWSVMAGIMCVISLMWD